ncbi:hypothetical protein AB1L88_12900 [Tautonia sp. JC769]|uniref:hypothetical protein n=1 Tax=Tautonia sp. JC769 TaxID=3232135 RepID=UPI00345A0B64
MFGYLISKIREAEFQDVPFRHLIIENFLSNEHFDAIVSSDEIRVPPQPDDESLFDDLFSRGYRIIGFPGCITDKDAYLEWHKSKSAQHGRNNPACEGFGMTLRLIEPQTPMIQELKAFLEAEEFNKALAEKFELPFEKTHADNGIQKYLDGYEISPHPDVRRKALTYMVNINPHPNADQLQHHTHYLKFTDRYNYVKEFWAGNPQIDRCWVPWPWCETVSEQRSNNSIVIFAPSNDTMHAVKANYNHLNGQRTQLYGNLWYKELHHGLPQFQWHEIDLPNTRAQREAQSAATPRPKARPSFVSKAKSIVPPGVKKALRAVTQPKPPVTPSKPTSTYVADRPGTSRKGQ